MSDRWPSGPDGRALSLDRPRSCPHSLIECVSCQVVRLDAEHQDRREAEEDFALYQENRRKNPEAKP